ncbi:MAG: hypothetical protein ACOCVC_07695 [Spirochaeta sp.]
MSKNHLRLRILFFSMLCAGTSVFAHDMPALAAGFTNDNYTGSLCAGKSGYYLGADDYITFGLFALGSLQNHRAILRYQIVTSRKFNWRHDLLHAFYGQDIAPVRFRYGEYHLSLRAGALLRGQWGGEIIQNTFHELRGFPLVELEYAEPGFSPAARISSAYTVYHPKLHALRWHLLADADVRTSILPVALSAGMAAELQSETLYGTYVFGWRQYVNEVAYYSELLRSGFYTGFHIGLRLGEYTLEGGILFVPVRNIQNDPVYPDKNRRHSPQIWFSMNTSGDGFSIRDYVYY